MLLGIFKYIKLLSISPKYIDQLVFLLLVVLYLEGILVTCPLLVA